MAFDDKVDNKAEEVGGKVKEWIGPKIKAIKDAAPEVISGLKVDISNWAEGTIEELAPKVQAWDRRPRSQTRARHRCDRFPMRPKFFYDKDDAGASIPTRDQIPALSTRMSSRARVRNGNPPRPGTETESER